MNILHSQILLKEKKIQVLMDEASGKFSITGLIPDKKGNEIKINIFSDKTWPPTSFTFVKYNDKVYEFGSAAGKTLKAGLENNSLIYLWKIKNALITQDISLKTIEPYHYIKINYLIENMDNNQNQVDIRLCLDNNINNNSHLYMFSSKEVLNNEIILKNISEWYCIDSVSEPGVFIKYIPDKKNYLPERIVFSSWENIYKNPWDFELNKSTPFYNKYAFQKKRDSAIYFCWTNLLSLNSKSTCSVKFEFGKPEVQEETLIITQIENNTNSKLLSYKFHNKSLMDLNNIKIEFGDNSLNRIKLNKTDEIIDNLPYLKTKNIHFSYSINANINRDVLFNVDALFSGKKVSFKHNKRINTGNPLINIEMIPSRDKEIIMQTNTKITTVTNEQISVSTNPDIIYLTNKEIAISTNIKIIGITNTKIFPIKFNVNYSNCINPKKWQINIYDNNEDQVHIIPLNREDSTENKLSVDWNGRYNHSRIEKGTYYFYSASFSNYCKDRFESEKDIILYPAEAVITETNILYTFPDINFDYDSAELKNFAYKILNHIADETLKYRESRFFINGYTDNIGSEEYNLTLSKERASSVFNYLVSQYNFIKANFSINGYGSANPVASNRNETGRKRNRRVEIVIEKK